MERRHGLLRSATKSDSGSQESSQPDAPKPSDQVPQKKVIPQREPVLVRYPTVPGYSDR